MDEFVFDDGTVFFCGKMFEMDMIVFIIFVFEVDFDSFFYLNLDFFCNFCKAFDTLKIYMVFDYKNAYVLKFRLKDAHLIYSSYFFSSILSLLSLSCFML